MHVRHVSQATEVVGNNRFWVTSRDFCAKNFVLRLQLLRMSLGMAPQVFLPACQQQIIPATSLPATCHKRDFGGKTLRGMLARQRQEEGDN